MTDTNENKQSLFNENHFFTLMNFVAGDAKVQPLSSEEIDALIQSDIREKKFFAAYRQACEEKEMSDGEKLAFSVEFLKPIVDDNERINLERIATLDIEQLEPAACENIDGEIARLVRKSGPSKETITSEDRQSYLKTAIHDLINTRLPFVPEDLNENGSFSEQGEQFFRSIHHRVNSLIQYVESKHTGTFDEFIRKLPVFIQKGHLDKFLAIREDAQSIFADYGHQPAVYEDPAFTQDTSYNPLYMDMARSLLGSDSLKPLPVSELQRVKAATGMDDGEELAACRGIIWRELAVRVNSQVLSVPIFTNISLFLDQCSEVFTKGETIFIARLMASAIKHDSNLKREKTEKDYLDYNALLGTPPQGDEAQRLSGDKEFCESLKAAMQNDLEPKKRMASFNRAVRKGQKKWEKARKSSLDMFKKANGAINGYFKKPKASSAALADDGSILVLTKKMRMPWYMKAQERILTASVQTHASIQAFLASTVQMMPSLDSLKPSNNRTKNALILAGAFVVVAAVIGTIIYLNPNGFHAPTTGNIGNDLAQNTSDAFRAAAKGAGKTAKIVAENTPASVPSAPAADTVQAATSSVTDIAEPVARNTAKAARHVIRAKATVVEHLASTAPAYDPAQDDRVMNGFLAAATDPNKALAALNNCPTEACQADMLKPFIR